MPQACDTSVELLEQTWFVVPAYNESTVIADTIHHLQDTCPNVIVFDDGSSDETSGTARAAGAIVAMHPINLGQGVAFATGFAVALRSGAQYLAALDADGQRDTDDVLRMLERLVETKSDVALGSRFLGLAPNMSAVRRMLLQAAVRYVRLTSSIRLTDAHNGLRVFTPKWCLGRTHS